MNLINKNPLHKFSRRFKLRAASIILAALSLVLALPAPAVLAYSVGQPVRVSAVGHTVGEVSMATSPVSPQVMIANTIDNDLPGSELVDQIRCAMYRSADAGASWSEVPAWPRTPELKPLHDPWVAVAPDGTMHATCIANVLGVGQVVYVKSTDHGLTWSAPKIIPPLTATASADKSVIEVGSDGRLLICSRQASKLILSQSFDQGNSWLTKSTGINAHCNGISTAPGGFITLAIMYGPNLGRAGTVTSTDNANNWRPIRKLAEADSLVALQFPSLVRDYTGRTVIAGVNNASSGQQLTISIQDDSGALLQQWQVATPSTQACTNGRLVHPQLTTAPNRLPALQIMCKISPTQTTAGEQEIWFYPVIDQPGNLQPPILTSHLDLPPIPAVPAPDSFAGRFTDGGFFWDITWRTDGWLSVWIDPRTGDGPGELTVAPVLIKENVANIGRAKE